MRQRINIMLVLLPIGFASLGCGDSKKEGGEANIVVREPIPEHVKRQPLPPLQAGNNGAPKPADQ